MAIEDNRKYGEAGRSGDAGNFGDAGLAGDPCGADCPICNPPPMLMALYPHLAEDYND